MVVQYHFLMKYSRQLTDGNQNFLLFSYNYKIDEGKLNKTRLKKKKKTDLIYQSDNNGILSHILTGHNILLNKET